MLATAAGVWLWLETMLGREAAHRAAGAWCARHGLQLLDDTVSLAHWRLRRPGGAWQVWRTYGFEFTDTGTRRRPGFVVLCGRRAVEAGGIPEHLDA